MAKAKNRILNNDKRLNQGIKYGIYIINDPLKMMNTNLGSIAQTDRNIISSGIFNFL